MHDVFDAIRQACAEVAAGARWVRIDHARLETYAAELRAQVSLIGDNDPGREGFGDPERTLSFVIALDAVNFGSGYFPHLAKRPGASGYHTIAGSLRDHVAAGRPLDAGVLAGATAEECARIFGQPLVPGTPVAELMALFATAWRDLGALVAERHGGSFVQLVDATGHSAAAFVAELDRMPFFHDVATWHGHHVPLYKRAQITVNDVAAALAGHPLGRFDDLDRLTMFPDNLVPHVLRVDGVLVVDPELVQRIEAEEDIPVGSEPEVEIRAVGLHAVERLTAELRHLGVTVPARALDTFLWNRGAGPTYKAVPRHRTRCVYY